MRKFITAIPAEQITSNFTAAVNTALELLINYRISLSDDEKAGTRSMAEDREGYVRLVSRIANQFPDALSRSDSPEDLVRHLDYYNRLEASRMALLQAQETIEEMRLGVSADIMTYADRYGANLKISRNHDASLDLAMREIDDWNSRFANRPPKTPAESQPPIVPDAPKMPPGE